MKIWIINPYGNLPGEGWRPYRSAMMADAFTKNGHEVIWWVSNFEHRSKKFRSVSWEDRQVNDNFLIRLVPSTSYSRHISFARIMHERRYARNFREKVWMSTDKPDLIVLGEPALFFSDIVIDVINKYKIPFILDIGDLWPELFNILLPTKLAKLGRILFSPLYWRRSQLLKKANGIIAVSKDYLKLGLDSNPNTFSEIVYWGVDIKTVNNYQNMAFESEILKTIQKMPGEKWVIYAGTLGNNYDISTILDCAKKLEKTQSSIKIFIAGDGPLRQLVENTIKNNKLAGAIYLGRLNANDLSLLYTKCDMALSSYVHGSTVSMPIKAYDYLAAGLPLINSLKRDLGDFVVNFNVGLQYKSGSAEDMLRAIVQLANDYKTCNQMKNNALILAESFDCNKQYSKVVELAEKITALKTA